MLNRSAIIFVENYVAGGSDKVARILIEGLPIRKLIVMINRSNDTSIILNNIIQNNIDIKYYGIVTYSELVIAAKSVGNKFLRYILLTMCLIVKYPLFLFSIGYFFLMLNHEKVDVFICNNGGYPGGDCCRSATIAASLIQKLNVFHIVHSMAYSPFPILAPFEWVIDRLIDVGSKVIVVSYSAAKRIKAVRSIRQDVKVVYNGLPDIRQRSSYTRSDKLHILNVGYFDENKNQSMLIKALAELVERGHSNVYVTFVGADAGELNSCVDLSRRLGVSHMICFEGFKNDVDFFYKNADILVHCSHVEGLPLVVLEAMRFGIPVISTNVGGIPEQIDNGVSGFIVDVNDYVSLADKISFFLDTRAMIKGFGLAGRSLYERKFSSETMISSYKKLFGLH